MVFRVAAVLTALLAVTGTVYAQAPDLAHMDLVLRSVPDGPIAKVNGVNIPSEEFAHMYQNEILGIISQTQSPQVPDRLRVAAAVRTLRLMVEHELLCQEAAKRKLSVSDSEVNAQWAATLEDMRKTLARLKDPNAGGSAQGADTISEAEILKRANTTREKALADLRKGLLAKKMRDKIAEESKVTVTDADVAKFFNENKGKFSRPNGVHLQQVFISTRSGKAPYDDKKMADARQRADNALKRLQAGESFEAVAKSASESPDKEKGGDMGTLPTTKLPPFVTEPISTMKPGEITKVITSDVGFHIFKLIEVIAGSEATLEKAGPGIRQLLLANKTEEAVGAYCKSSLDDPKKVEIYLQLDKTLANNPEFQDLKAGADAKEPAKQKAATQTTTQKSTTKEASAPKSTPSKKSKSKKKSASTTQ